MTSFLKNQKLVRPIWSTRYGYVGELLDDSNHAYVSIFAGQRLSHKKVFQLLVLFNQNRIIVQDYSSILWWYKEITGDSIEIATFVSYINGLKTIQYK